MPEFNKKFRFRNLPDESTPKSAENLNVSLENLYAICGDSAGAHNAFFRGEDVTKYLEDGSLWERISSGTFDDLFVGDYIIKNNITWRIAGFDIYLNKGTKPLVKHHAVIVPDKILTKARMIPESTITVGISDSEMYKSTLNQVLEDYITPIFGEHVLEFSQTIPNQFDANAANRGSGSTGASSNFGWFDRKISLMNENQVFGSIVWASSGYETGCDNVQFPLFRLAPEFVCCNNYYWLQNIADKTKFAYVGDNGLSHLLSTPNAENGGVRPYFYID